MMFDDIINGTSLGEKNKLIENKVIHKGFYSEHIDETKCMLCELRNPKWNYTDEDDDLPGFAYETADVFLAGSCWLFSIVLKNEENFSAYEIRGNNNRLIHTFCHTVFCGQDAYVDIRGITTDFNEFVAPLYIYRNEKISIVPQDVVNDFEMMTDDEKYGYEFAVFLYNKNKEYYSQ